MTEVVVAVDPGRDKCGVAVVSVSGQVEEKAVVEAGRLAAFVSRILADRRYRIAAVAVGDRTATAAVVERLKAAGVPAEHIYLVDEHRSSEVGRRRYWRDNPPRGWRRLIPVGLQVPPEPYDDYVAVELAFRYLASSGAGPEEDEKKRAAKVNGT